MLVVEAVIAALALLVFALVINTAISVARRELYFLRRGWTRTSLAMTLALIARETAAVAVVLAWRLLRRGRRIGASGRGPTVVLVHGMWADGTSMWGLRSALIERGWATSAPDLDASNIERAAADLVEVLASTADRIDVVCHSLGGIVLRVALAERPELGAHIRCVVNLAVPDDGTGAAVGIPLAVARALVPGSAFLDTLPTLTSLVPHGVIIRVSSRHDPIVYPLPANCETLVLDGCGHAELLVARSMRQYVADALVEARGASVVEGLAGLRSGAAALQQERERRHAEH